MTTYFIKSIVNNNEYFYLDEQYWVQCDESAYRDKLAKCDKNLVHRTKAIFFDGSGWEIWYRGLCKHRLDGPAEIDIHKNGKITSGEWFVDGTLLRGLGTYDFNHEDIFPMLLEYVQQYPEFNEKIARLCSHNNWITEEQILVLSSVGLF